MQNTLILLLAFIFGATPSLAQSNLVDMARNMADSTLLGELSNLSSGELKAEYEAFALAKKGAKVDRSVAEARETLRESAESATVSKAELKAAIEQAMQAGSIKADMAFLAAILTCERPETLQLDYSTPQWSQSVLLAFSQTPEVFRCGPDAEAGER